MIRVCDHAGGANERCGANLPVQRTISNSRDNFIQHTPFVSKHCRAGRPALALTIAWQKNVCQERSAKSQPVCILCCTGCRPVKLCILKFYLISRCIFCKESQSLYSSYSSPSSAAMNWGTALGSMPRMYANSLCSRFCASCKARSSKAESPLPWALRAW